MNFGKWIIVAFILFGAFISTLVGVCMRQNVSLVAKDYYKEELGYQDQIRRLNNTAELKEKPVIKVSGNTVTVDYKDFEKIESGRLTLFCPSNEGMDRTFTLSSSDSREQQFVTDGLKKGMYRAKMSWTMHGKEFFQEDVIYL